MENIFDLSFSILQSMVWHVSTPTTPMIDLQVVRISLKFYLKECKVGRCFPLPLAWIIMYFASVIPDPGIPWWWSFSLAYTSCICLVKKHKVQFVYILQVEKEWRNFPNTLGNFETTMRLKRTELEVKGVTVAPVENFQLSSTQDFRILSTASTSTSGTTFSQDLASSRSPVQNALTLQRPKSSGEILRKVFIAEFNVESLTLVQWQLHISN